MGGPVGGTLLRPGGTIVVGVQKRAFSKFQARTIRPSYGQNARVNRPIATFLRGCPTVLEGKPA